MRIPLYQVDAFTDRLFGGNPAAVCPLEGWLPDATLQAIAAENNLSETAFLVPRGDDYDLRWFTPTVEMDLCGHATLASAHVVFHRLAPGRQLVSFHTVQAGVLTVARHGDLLSMDFPSRPPGPVAPVEGLAAMLGRAPVELWTSRDLLVVYERTADVLALAPDFKAMAALNHFAVIVTAPGEDGVDFVSRFFAPLEGVPEDPVTGSAHCTLIPYWGRRLGKTQLRARQVSKRGGELFCTWSGDRVGIAGHAVLYLEGTIEV